MSGDRGLKFRTYSRWSDVQLVTIERDRVMTQAEDRPSFVRLGTRFIPALSYERAGTPLHGVNGQPIAR